MLDLQQKLSTAIQSKDMWKGEVKKLEQVQCNNKRNPASPGVWLYGSMVACVISSLLS